MCGKVNVIREFGKTLYRRRRPAAGGCIRRQGPTAAGQSTHTHLDSSPASRVKRPARGYVGVGVGYVQLYDAAGERGHPGAAPPHKTRLFNRLNPVPTHKWPPSEPQHSVHTHN